MKKDALRLERIRLKGPDGANQLNDMNMYIYQGEIFGLIGLDSYGREALFQLLEQNIPLDYGYVYYREELVNSYQYSSMSKNRVAVIEEQSHLVERLTVADNLFVLRRGFKQYYVRSDLLIEQCKRLMAEVDIELDGRRPVWRLSRFECCMIELIKAANMGMSLVILKDISNFISAADLSRFKKAIRFYAEKGISFLYVCHHHEDAFSICDRVGLMEGGRIVKTIGRENYKDEIIPHYALDFGRIPVSRAVSPNEGLLKFERVSTEKIQDMSFAVQKGECVVFQDMNNVAWQDMFALMSGDMEAKSGRILFQGKDLAKQRKKLMKDINYILDDPAQSMIFPEMSFIDNLCFSLDRKQRGIWLSERLRNSIQQEYEPLIGPAIYKNNITNLSQETLYSLAYARVHLYHPDLCFIVQPFAHADMYLRYHIIRLIRWLQSHKITIVIFAVNLADCLVVADRLMIIQKGRLSMEVSNDEFQLLKPEPYLKPGIRK